MLILATILQSATNSHGQGARPTQVKGLWILPNEFSVNQTPSVLKDDVLEKQGAKFLESYKTLSPDMDATTLVGNKVTRVNIIKEIRKKMESFDSNKQPCMFVLYYGGHGIRPSGRPKASTYLALQGANIDELDSQKLTYETMIQIDEVISLISEFEHIYFQVYLDCCYSGNILLANDWAFSSSILGANGFAICSSVGDRKAYATSESSATLGLTDIFSKSFDEIQTPLKLYEALVANPKTGDLAQISFRPRGGGANLVNWPLSKKCFLVLDFGRPIGNQSVIARVSDSSGRRIGSFPLREGGSSLEPPVLLRGLAVPRTNLSISFEIGDATIIPASGNGYPLSLAGKNSDHFKIPSGDLRSIDTARLTANEISTSVETILAQATDFGITAQEQQGIVISALASAESIYGSTAGEDIIAWAKKFDIAFYEPGFRQLITDYTGSTEIPVNEEGFVRIQNLKKAGIGYSEPIAKAYASHIARNVSNQIAIREEGEPLNEKPWISVAALTANFEQAAKVTALSRSIESFALLEDAAKEASAPKTNLFKSSDERKVKNAIKEASKSFK